MRVTHVITRLIVGGAQENTLSSVLGLREKKDLEVRLIAGPTTGPEGSIEHLVSEIPGLFTRLPDLVRPVRPAKDLAACRRLTRMFRETAPEIVHTHSGKAGILGRIAARRAGVPIIIHSIHGPSFGNFQGPVANFLYRHAERWTGRMTTHFISVAHAMSRQYLAAGIGRESQYTRVFSGFDLEAFLRAGNDLELRRKWGIAPEDFVVGKVARLIDLKGHDDLFHVLPELARRIPRLKVLLVGGGDWQPRFESLARRLGLEQHVIFTGLVNPGEVPALIGIMDVLTHLSRREGLPRALPQALAVGRPVVAFDCDGAGEVCLDGRTGMLLPPGDHGGLVQALEKLAVDPALRHDMGTQGRELVRRHFTIDQLVEGQYRVYQSLYQEHQAAIARP